LTRWDAFTALCGYLRAALLDGERSAPRPFSWESLIEIASFHYVTPTVGGCLGDEADVPGDVREYFAAAAALNGRRNALMQASLARVAGMLNAIDIAPMPLKGAAHLAGSLYPDPSLRLLGDLDVLIPADRAAEAQAALKAGGFAGKPSDIVPGPQHHHLPILHDGETGVGVELHTDVIDRSPDAAIATGWFCESARPAVFRDRRILLPDPTRNAGHIIFHSEIFHEHHSLKKVQLRHLLDLALMQRQHADAIDWEMLDRRFSAAGLGQVLATYLGFSEELFGRPAPKLSHAPRANAMEDMRRAESRDGFHAQIEILRATCDRLVTDISHMTVSRDHYRTLAENLEYGLQHASSARDDFATVAERTRAAYEHVRSEAQRLEAKLIRVGAARDETARQLSIMERSTSWRLTWPLRALVTALRRPTAGRQ
jgi:hypothetical protein